MSFWTVAQTESQREQVAADFLKMNGFEPYLPQIAVRRGGKASSAPLFPSYLFVLVHDRWYSIRWTIGVLRVLMWDDHPAQVPDRVVTALQKRAGPDGLIRLPRPRGLQRGDQVRIIRGHLVGQLGLYDGQPAADRVRVLINMLGRMVPTTVPKADIAATLAAE